MIRLLLILLSFATPAIAEPARVYSGEHGAFTRLVVELPTASKWTVGRTDTGYAFAANRPTQPKYDLSGVWQRIARTRVSALEIDPDTGILLLTLGCACHVFPFEYRPGAVVLDIKPGPPPAGSAFESDLSGEPNPAVASDPTPEANPSSGYDWLADLPTSDAQHLGTRPLPLATGEVSLDPLRNALLEQIALGAADGVVDMGRPVPTDTTTPSGEVALPWSSLRIGERPGILISDPDTIAPGMMPAAPCAENDLLEIGSWGGTGTPQDLLASSRSGLYGEFDAADPVAMVQSVRSHLFLGFGAEAAQLADFVNDGRDADPLALYRSMARILDGDGDPDTPFATMLDCDGPAALWAALARDRLPPGKGVNREAILRAFLALPPHLRGHLGSNLAEKFLALEDSGAVRIIRDAMERTPHINPATVALLDAENDLHLGNTDAAQSHARRAVALDGNQAEGLVTLVEAHFRKMEPISPEVVDALLSLRGEMRNTDLDGAVDRAIILAQALSGQTEAALHHQEIAGETRVDLWRVVQEHATDDDFLRHAVLPVDSPPPDLAPELDLEIAKRLLGLGFSDSALTWIGPVLPTDPATRRVAAATAFLDLGDARSAIGLLEGLTEVEATTILAQALLQLGDLPAAANVLSAAGQSDAATRTSLWQGDWSTLDQSVPEAWQSAARLAQSIESDGSKGLLGRGAQAVEVSITSRSAIEALLDSVALPDSN